MSDESIAALTLRGDLPGLLRRGSPVVATTEDWDGCSYWGGTYLGDRGVVTVTVVDDCLWVAWMEPDREALMPADISKLALDLRDATGRAHAAWWLAAQVKNWPDEPVYTTASWWCGEGRACGPVWALRKSHYWPATHISIRHLDPSDPRLLEDGSRWVDAMALKLVCEHVAGRS